MKLERLLDIEKLSEHVNNGYVSVSPHPSMPLYIYNYTQKAQFDNKWGDGTIDYCRGLIVDELGNVVSRPFKKFHNLNTAGIPETLAVNLPPWNLSTVTEKLDGSLGILYRYQGRSGIATRGSFVSEQAQWANEWYAKNCTNPLWLEGFTALFEIIYPENRIVVSYPFEGLVLLAMINNETGKEISHDALQYYALTNGMRCASNIAGHSLEDLLEINRPNEEGFVVTFDNGLKVKIKMADYVRLHKLLTGMNPKSVWEMLSKNTGPQKLWELVNDKSVPEHFIKWLVSWQTELQKQHDAIFATAAVAFKNKPEFYGNFDLMGLDLFDQKLWVERKKKEERAEFAAYVKTLPAELHGVLFTMFDGRDPGQMIWKQIKPRGDDKSFRVEGE